MRSPDLLDRSTAVSAAGRCPRVEAAGQERGHQEAGERRAGRRPAPRRGENPEYRRRPGSGVRCGTNLGAVIAERSGTGSESTTLSTRSRDP